MKEEVIYELRDVTQFIEDKLLLDGLFQKLSNIDANQEMFKFIFTSKSIICHQVELPFNLRLPNNFEFMIFRKNQYIASFKSDINPNNTTLLIYKCLPEKYNVINSSIIFETIKESYETVNEVCKLIKVRFGNMNVFTIHEGNKTECERIFTFDNVKKKGISAFELDNIASIYSQEKPKAKQLFDNDKEAEYFISKINEEEKDILMNAFYYFTLAKQDELDKNFNDALIKAQTGFEILFVETLKKLQKINKFNQKIDIDNCNYRNIIDHHLGKLLSKNGLIFNGSKDDKENILYDYWNNIYLFRNKVVHRGHMVTYEDYHLLIRPAWDKTLIIFVNQLNILFPEIKIKMFS